jgi:hypothetical protein
MSHVNDFLGTAMPWHEEHCQGVLDAFFAQDEARFHIEIAGVWSRLRSDPDLSPDEVRALEYLLLQYEYLIINRCYGDLEQAEQFAITYPRLTELEPLGPLSDSVQAFILISMLGLGVRRGFISMSEAEVDSLVARVPEEHKTPNFWFYVVVWAFLASNLKYLEEAFARQTVETTGWMDDYYWQRTNLMYLLVSKRATKLDVRKTLLGYEYPHQIADFANLFMPRCIAMGLMDDELRELHRRRVEELKALHGQQPHSKPRTTRIARD